MSNSSHKPSETTTARRRVALVMCLGLASIAGGCYDGEALVERIRSKAIRTRLDEIDLGQYRITLPQDTEKNESVEVTIHLFAHAARHKIDDLEEELEAKSFLVHDHMLTSFRHFTRADLDDPDLEHVRGEVLQTLNGLLEEPLLSSLGMYDFRISRH